ncbi:uncharacterized protein LOC111701046 [Eurytemora carolleeae]|uniref:uncharacterized protein LOC111701046 n=1 Tax=Eurytemora carolleeae TaxID=1294199 RepID=UPI000C758F8D|nr:uncharacterized protein LOC111701046 [Eurytemora carolleeae]|eukprot:XP_023327930.1 uncharacterized protein LOC111701046 [Eurytemora affinis]
MRVQIYLLLVLSSVLMIQARVLNHVSSSIQGQAQGLERVARDIDISAEHKYIDKSESTHNLVKRQSSRTGRKALRKHRPSNISFFQFLGLRNPGPSRPRPRPV